MLCPEEPALQVDERIIASLKNNICTSTTLCAAERIVHSCQKSFVQHSLLVSTSPPPSHLSRGEGRRDSMCDTIPAYVMAARTLECSMVQSGAYSMWPVNQALSTPPMPQPECTSLPARADGLHLPVEAQSHLPTRPRRAYNAVLKPKLQRTNQLEFSSVGIGRAYGQLHC